ncbi:MAG: hypothetical protein ACKV2Q_32570 [Planctomycetaceae bacterium]
MTLLKLLFDECLGKPHIEILKSLVSLEAADSRPIVEHLLSIQDQGVLDEVWVPRVAHENWILMTSDKSRFKKGKGEPLPRLCVKHRITHVLLSPTVGQRRAFEKMLTIISVWYRILELSKEPRGSRFMIEPIGTEDADKGTGKLAKKSFPGIVPPPPFETLPFPRLDELLPESPSSQS